MFTFVDSFLLQLQAGWHWGPFWPEVWSSYGFWIILFLLGAYHGINPGMGWLFAVSLGLQDRSRRSVVGALPPLLLGHMISIGAIVAALTLVEGRLPHLALRVVASLVLVTFGLSRLLRSRHPRWARWVGMRVGFRDLTVWSFLMASAHGAGLMLVPFILGWSGGRRAGASPPIGPMNASAGHVTVHHGLALTSTQMSAAHSMGFAGGFIGGSVARSVLLPVTVHTLGYLLLTGFVALLVYEKLGVAVLRRAWFNLDLVWAAALLATGLLTLFL
jgi:hypothetical protein